MFLGRGDSHSVSFGNCIVHQFHLHKKFCFVFNFVCICVVYFDQQMHGQKQWKTVKNHEKSTFFIMRMRGSCMAHEEKQRKSLLVIFFMGLTWASHVQDEKGSFYGFWMFFIVFNHANECASKLLLVELHNIYIYLCKSQLLKVMQKSNYNEYLLPILQKPSYKLNKHAELK